MMRIASLIAGGLTAVSALPALAQQAGGGGPGSGPGDGYGYGYGHMHMWGWHGGMFFGPLLWVLILCGIVALVARITGWGRYGYHRRHGGGALDVLEERFARGEIDKAEFEEKRKLLNR